MMKIATQGEERSNELIYHSCHEANSDRSSTIRNCYVQII